MCILRFRVWGFRVLGCKRVRSGASGVCCDAALTRAGSGQCGFERIMLRAMLLCSDGC